MDPAREALVVQHVRLADSIAGKHAREHGGDFDIVRSNARLGLVLAALNFDMASEVPFRLYAGHRINGAILDAVRKENGNRLCRERYLLVGRATGALQQRLSRQPTEAEVAEELGLGAKQLQEWQWRIHQNANARLPVSLDAPQDNERGDELTLLDQLAAEGEEGPSLIDRERHERLRKAITYLPPRQRQAVMLYWWEGMTQQQIGKVFGITESRINQILRAAVKWLGEYLRTSEALEDDIEPISSLIKEQIT